MFAHELGFLEYRVSQTASDEDPKPTLIVRMGFCTAKSLTLCVLSVACTHFQIDETTFNPEYHSGLIWIQTMFANVERERDQCRHIKVKIPSADRHVEAERGSTSRGREMCVFFLISSVFFFTLGTHLRI